MLPPEASLSSVFQSYSFHTHEKLRNRQKQALVVGVKPFQSKIELEQNGKSHACALRETKLKD